MPANIQTPTWEEFEAQQKRIDRLTETVTYLSMILDPWVTAAKAAEITGRDEKTLRIERDRPGTLLKYKKDGSTVRYSLESLREYNQGRRNVLPTETARRATNG